MPTIFSFAAQVDAWVKKTKQRTEAVFKESAQRVISDMQTPVGAGGNMPIDTGFLRASLQTTLNAPTAKITYRQSDAPVTFDTSAPALTIAGAKLGDTVYAVYGANYAPYVEYGTGGRAGRGFVRLAAQRWPEIVSQAATEARGRAQSR